MKNDKILKNNLSTLLKKFSKGNVIAEMEKEYQSYHYNNIDPSLIDDNSFLKKAKIPEKSLRFLGDAIGEEGLITPLLVRPKKDHYEIILGRKRLLVAKLLKLKSVPVVIQDISNEEMLFMLIADMRDRKDRNIVEMALLYQQLTKNYGFSQTSVCEFTHQSRPQINNIMRILNLSDSILFDISIGKLSYGHAKAISSLPESVVSDIVKKIYVDNLSVRETEALVRRNKKLNNDDKIVSRLNKKYHAKVKLTVKGVVFSFSSNEERNNFIKKITH